MSYSTYSTVEDPERCFLHPGLSGGAQRNLFCRDSQQLWLGP